MNIQLFKQRKNELFQKRGTNLRASTEDIEFSGDLDESLSTETIADEFIDENVIEYVNEDIVEELKGELKLDKVNDADEVHLLIEQNDEMVSTLENLYVVVPPMVQKHGDIIKELHALNLGLESVIPKYTLGLEASLTGIAKGIKDVVVDGISLNIIKAKQAWERFKSMFKKLPMDNDDIEGGIRDIIKNYESYEGSLDDKLVAEILINELADAMYPKTIKMLKGKTVVTASQFWDVFIPEFYELERKRMGDNPFAHPDAVDKYHSTTAVFENSVRYLSSARSIQNYNKMIKYLEQFSKTGSYSFIDSALVEEEVMTNNIKSYSSLDEYFKKQSSPRFKISDFYPKEAESQYWTSLTVTYSWLRNARRDLPFLVEHPVEMDVVEQITADCISKAKEHHDNAVLKDIKKITSTLGDFVEACSDCIDKYMILKDANIRLIRISSIPALYANKASLNNKDVRKNINYVHLVSASESFDMGDTLSTISDALDGFKIFRNQTVKQKANSESASLGNKARTTEFYIEDLDKIESSKELKDFKAFLKKSKTDKFTIDVLEKFLVIDDVLPHRDTKISMRVLAGEEFNDLYGEAKAFDNKMLNMTRSIERAIEKGDDGLNYSLYTKALSNTEEALLSITQITNKINNSKPNLKFDPEQDIKVAPLMRALADATLASEEIIDAIDDDFFKDLHEFLDDKEADVVNDDTTKQMWKNLSSILKLTKETVSFNKRLTSELESLQKVDSTVVQVYHELIQG